MIISEIAYELYKQDWIDTHTTEKERVESLRNYYSFAKQSVDNYNKYSSYEDWLSDFGFNGSIYSCYNEFLDNEYRDKEYMFDLFGDTKLYDLYHKDCKWRNINE